MKRDYKSIGVSTGLSLAEDVRLSHYDESMLLFDVSRIWLFFSFDCQLTKST